MSWLLIRSEEAQPLQQSSLITPPSSDTTRGEVNTFVASVFLKSPHLGAGRGPLPEHPEAAVPAEAQIRAECYSRGPVPIHHGRGMSGNLWTALREETKGRRHTRCQSSHSHVVTQS
ncbi:uncharacterized protein [Dermacentor andersoni]|uniref:uncharacterized protein n=1 Tax=Dermacentor andersoni TaxID=34620 RepID=UPI002416F64C|nr:uncharacterized protein LOC129386995 [Dermacentor andersoni]